MKLNTTDFLRKSQFPPMIALAALPVFTIIVLQNVPEVFPALGVLLPAYVLCAWLCMLIPGKVRLPAGLIACAGLIALSLRLLPITHDVGQSVLCAFIPLALCGLLLYSLQFAAWPREKEIPFNWYAAGVITHLIAQLMGFASRRLGMSTWNTATPILTAAFILFMMLVLLSMNRTTMLGASLGRQHIPPSMRRRNIAITLSLLGAALVIAAIPAIVEFVERVWSLVIGAVGAVIAFIAKFLETETAPGMGGSGGGMDMMPPVEHQEPSLLALILEKIVTALAFVIAALLLLFLLRQTLRLLIALIRKITSRLSMYMSTASQDYVDEITDTREEGGEASGSLLSRLRRSLSRVNEKNLTPAQRIRYHYRLLLRRHPDWPQSHTARENLPPESASLYEAARYSGQEITEQDAETFKKAVSSNG